MVQGDVRFIPMLLNFKPHTMQELAKKICIYNGMRGTDKQVMQCIKSFGGNYEIMLQFAKGRIKL